MLHVLIIGAGLDRVMELATDCQKQYAFDITALSDLKSEDVVPAADTLLVFLGADPQERGNETARCWRNLALLQQVARVRLVRVFLVSAGSDFDSDEAQRAWMHYSIVLGYDLQSSLMREDVQAVIAEMAAMAAEKMPEKEQPRVGTRLRMPLGEEAERTPQSIHQEYMRHKFVSFLTGGMREALVQLRQAMQAIDRCRPLPLNAAGQFIHPFSAKNVQERFEAVAGAIYGAGASTDSTRERDRETETWLQTLAAGRNPNAIMPHVLLLGETGTGKTLLAQWMHRSRFERASAGRNGKDNVDTLFQDLNCGGMSPNLLDSELFGGIAGAWSSLDRNMPGKIFCACQGTLFLDEIGEMPLLTQTILLKFMDDNSYYPVGGHGQKLCIPTTIIAATNRDIARQVEQGTFRRDLYERFRFQVRLPSLKQRLEHLDDLVDFVLQNPLINPVVAVDPETGVVKRSVDYLSRRALRSLREYDWPGNFRELEQVLWRAVLVAESEGQSTLLPRHILFHHVP